MEESVQEVRRKVDTYFWRRNQVELYVDNLMKMLPEEERFAEETAKVQSLADQLKEIQEEYEEKLNSLARTLQDHEEITKDRQNRTRQEEEDRLVQELKDLNLAFSMAKKEEEKLCEKSMEMQLELSEITTNHRIRLTRASQAKLTEVEKTRVILQLQSKELANEYSLRKSKDMFLNRKEISKWEEQIEREEKKIRRLNDLLIKSRESAMIG